MPTSSPTKSPQTVRANGERVAPVIHGVKIKRPVTQQDDRGTLCEIYHPAWLFDDLPTPAAYLVTVNVGRVKGWAVHTEQIDRYFFAAGQIKLVLYDARDGSPTFNMINELYFGEINRALVSVPPGIYHAVENTGNTEALLFNLPSNPYRHEDPDKYTLPLDNDLIPYSFDKVKGY